MKSPQSFKNITLFLSAAAIALSASVAHAQVIVDYEFVDASPAATVGSSISSLSTLGGLNVGGYDNWSAGSDVGTQRIFFFGVSGAGRSIDISLDATGFEDITLGSFFQMSARNTGAAVDWQLSYSTDGGSNFSQIGSDFSIIQVGGTNSDLSQITAGSNFTLDAAADNNPNIVFRINSAPGSLNFVGGTALGGALNFDNFSISATAIPEPSTYAAITGLVALGLLLIRRRRK